MASLWDVKHPSGLSERTIAQFDLTRAACEEVGWLYDVWTGLPEPRTSTLRWLAGYRMDRYEPSPDVREALTAAFAGGCPMRVGVTRAGRVVDVPREVLLAGVYHLIWSHAPMVDLDSPLGLDSEVRPA